MKIERAWLGIVLCGAVAPALLDCVGDEPQFSDDGGAVQDGGGGGDAIASGRGSSSDGGADAEPSCIAPTSATPGALDPTYNNSLKNIPKFVGPASAAVDAQGRVYVVGVGDNCTKASNSDLAVVRFDANGGLDTTFNAGSALKCFDLDSIEHGYAIAIDGNGKILAGGISGHTNRFFASVVRFDDHATLDPSFGTGGVVDVQGPDGGAPAAGGKFDVVYGIGIVPGSNKVILVGGDDNGGAGGSQTGFIMRLGNDGSADVGFGTNGLYTDTSNTLFYNAAVDPAGGVAAPSRQQFSSVNQIIVTKLDGTGHLAAGFGTGGMASIPSAGDQGDEAHTIVQLPNGNLLAVGARDIVGGGPAAIAPGAAVMFAGDGSVDSTFGTGGITPMPANIMYSYGYFSNVAARYCTGDLFIAEQRNDGVAGYTDAAAQDTALLHLSPAGAIDTSYGEGGVARAFYVGGDIPISAMVDPVSGKILVVSSDATGRVGIFRFEP